MEAGQAWWPLRAAVLAAWVADYPGTRPPIWWRLDAPEPRREVAGSATWLRHPDRGLLEVYARLLVEQRTAFADMNAARLTLLVTLGARLGLAPIDRTRLEPKPEPKPHRF